MTKDQREIQRKLRILRYAEEIRHVARTCRYFGIGRASFYRWRKAYATLSRQGKVDLYAQPFAVKIIQDVQQSECPSIAQSVSHEIHRPGYVWRVWDCYRSKLENEMTIAFMGIDLARNVFQLHGVDAEGTAVFKTRVRREALLAGLADMPACGIGIEACTGAFWWQRQFEALGHTVKVIAPQYVKPFLKHQKNDRNDAEAICTALMQPNMKFVPPGNEEQQDIQALHRARRRLVKHRIALACQMRGRLLDRGVTIPLTLGRARQRIPEILEEQSNGLTDMTREIIADLFEFMLQLDARIKAFDRCIDQVFRANPDCQRIARICGLGSKTATAVVAAVGDGKEFRNGRHMAAWMGLVPRQHSSGDKRLLMGISKRGDKHLRTLLPRCPIRRPRVTRSN